MIIVFPPFILFLTNWPCWRCGSERRVGAFAVRQLEQDGWEESGDVFLLQGIQELPRFLIEAAIAEGLRLRLVRSKTAEDSYVANTCACGAFFGEHFLFSTPGGAFFPQRREEAARVRYTTIEWESPIKIDATWSVGPGEFMCEHGSKADA